MMTREMLIYCVSLIVHIPKRVPRSMYVYDVVCTIITPIEKFFDARSSS